MAKYTFKTYIMLVVTKTYSNNHELIVYYTPYTFKIKADTIPSVFWKDPYFNRPLREAVEISMKDVMKENFNIYMRRLK